MIGLTTPEWAAVGLSLQVATVCLLLLAGPAIAIGVLLARREFTGKILVDVLVHLPLVLPPVVTGYLLLVLFAKSGLFGNLGIAFTWWAAVVSSAVMGFPLMVRAVRVGVELVDPALEQAARTLGASRWRVLGTVTLPLAMPGLVAGAALAFARSLGEFGATITFAGNIPFETQTLPLALFSAIQMPGGESGAIRLVVVSLILSVGALAGSELLVRRLRRLREGR